MAMRPRPGDDDKPDNHDRTEKFADAAGAMTLGPKQENQDHAGQGQDQGLGLGGGHFQTFQGGEDGNDRGDEPIAVQQGGTEQPRQDQSPAQVGAQVLVEQGQHGEDAAFALVVGAHDEQGIFDADHQDQGPENQGHQPQDIWGRRGNGGLAGKADLEGVQGTGADVAEDDSQGADDQDMQFFL